MRKGEKWYYKSCELFLKHLGKESVYYRGFKNVLVDGRMHLAGVFETVDPNLNLDKFAKRFKNYHNKECHIVAITCHKSIGNYKNCILVHLER